MKYFLFTRKITKKEAIDKYGKIGYRLHLEGVTVEAMNLEEARERIKPFNYKKHIKFEFKEEIGGFDNYDLHFYGIEEIKDLGVI